MTYIFVRVVSGESLTLWSTKLYIQAYKLYHIEFKDLRVVYTALKYNDYKYVRIHLYIFLMKKNKDIFRILLLWFRITRKLLVILTRNRVHFPRIKLRILKCIIMKKKHRHLFKYDLFDTNIIHDLLAVLESINYMCSIITFIYVYFEYCFPQIIYFCRLLIRTF